MATTKNTSIRKLQRATHVSLEVAKRLYSGDPPELGSRILRAAEYQKGSLHDPIEDEPVVGPIVAAASKQAADEMLKKIGGRYILGACYGIWARKKEILSAEHGLVWFSPKEMNPMTIFD